MTNQGRSVARDNIGREMARRGWNVSDLARTAGIDLGTAGDFLNGARWPQRATQAKIETVFGWPAGIIRRWELEEEDSGTLPRSPERTEAPGDPEEVVLSVLPPDALEGLSQANRKEVASRMIVTALTAIREIRRDGDL